MYALLAVSHLHLLQDWLSEAQLGQTFDQYDADHSGDISFDEFIHMVGALPPGSVSCTSGSQLRRCNCGSWLLAKSFSVLQYEDGHMLAVQLAKYKLMFDEVDTSGNGSLGAAEIQHFFHK